MISSTVLDLINGIEERFPVEQWVIGGLHIWPIIRITLYFDLIFANDKNAKSKYRKYLFDMFNKMLKEVGGISKYGYAFLFDYKKNSRPNRLFDAVFLSDGTTRSWVHDAWHEKLCDPFINHFNDLHMSCFHLESRHEYHIPRNNPSMFIQPYLDYIRIRSKFLMRKRNLIKVQMLGFSDFINYLKAKNFSIRMLGLEEIKKEVILILLFSEFYKKIFRRIKPSIGFVVSYYSREGMAFNLACREFGIPSVDIQHGVECKLHAAYGRWNRICCSGYELLPTVFWCWSDKEATTIEKWSKNVQKWHQPLVGGNLGLNLWQYGNNDFIAYYDQKIKEKKEQYSDVVHILLTLQPGGFSDYEKLQNILEAIKSSQTFWHWWIRLHPGMVKQKKKIKMLLKENEIKDMELDAATDLPLYALLRHMDVHITYSSSTVIEAECFGVPSVITSEYGAELFPEQLSSGVALIAYSPNEIIGAIQCQINRGEFLKKHRVISKVSADRIAVLLNLIVQNKRSRKLERKQEED